eukprot:TRINITY_DN8362_c0_g1_i7.p1 TRINITY_DN8362_c0_g1~~TRINITY_DN8362_c0_g1_i7.p1  ORF type:complete len:410 (-),score=118.32 TRINITY_DN8362_c0_g1_i7:1779-3008(-)
MLGRCAPRAAAAAVGSSCRRSLLSSTVGIVMSRGWSDRVIGSVVDNGIMRDDTLMSSGLPPPLFRFIHEVTNQVLTPDENHQCLQEMFSQVAHQDPFHAVQENLAVIKNNFLHIVASDVPILKRVASHLFETQGKRLRPAIVLLVSKAIDQEVSSRQQRLSEITEMLHTASLLHDDVLDDAELRRGVPSANALFGNKAAILGGDYLLSRASVELARLENIQVVELMATVLEHLVKGEVLQSHLQSSTSLMDLYLCKTFYKTASLIANGCKSAVVLSGHDEEIQDIVFEYGRHLGILFQIIDDLLDFEASAKIVGKPVLNDISHGIASAPLILAAEEHPVLFEMISRRFSEAGDVQTSLELLKESNGMKRARELAWEHASFAVAAIMKLPRSTARSSLIRIVDMALHRKS